MTEHRPHRRQQRVRRSDRVLRIRGELRTPPDLRVLAEALIDLAHDADNEPDLPTGTDSLNGTA